MENFVQCFPLTWLLLDQIYLIQCNTYLSKQRAWKTAVTNLIYLYFQTFYKQLCISILKFKYSELYLFVKPIIHQNQLCQNHYWENFKITDHKYRFWTLKITLFLADIGYLVLEAVSVNSFMLGQTIKQPLSNFEPRKRIYKQLWELMLDPIVAYKKRLYIPWLWQHKW